MSTNKKIFNHDYPYHDFKQISDGEEPTVYAVGNDNKDASGDQKKLFVAKDTLIYCTQEVTLSFNHSANVTITIPASLLITFECNINKVFIKTIGTDGELYMYFEGVLPEECRDAE